jgi:hypothetical protein
LFISRVALPVDQVDKGGFVLVFKLVRLKAGRLASPIGSAVQHCERCDGGEETKIEAEQAARHCGERRKCDDYEHGSSRTSGCVGNLKANCKRATFVGHRLRARMLMSKTQKGLADDFIGEQVSPDTFDGDMTFLKDVGPLHNFKRLIRVLLNKDQTDTGIQNCLDQLE